MKFLISCFCFLIMMFAANAQVNIPSPAAEPGVKIVTGAERMHVYLPLIKGKTVGIFANHTSMVGNTHLVDTLRKSGVKIKVIFGPEHGFRGTAPAGEKIGNYTDEK